MEHYGWEQYVWLFIYFINLSVAGLMHGKPRTGEWNFHVAMVAALISFILLRSGGFF